MNESDINTPVPDSPPAEDQAGLIASLRHQITFLLLALIVISGTLTLYLFYQSRVFGREIASLEPQARLVVENYNRNWPEVQKVVQELEVYGQKHPDFQPILKRFGIPLQRPAATNAAARPGMARPIAPKPKAPKP